MAYYIYSTLAQNTAYAFYKTIVEKNDLLEIERVIEIKGGAGVADKNFITPSGKVTKIIDEEYELLKTNPVFQQHVKNGFIIAQKTNSDIDTIIKKMEPRDRSAPIRPEDCGSLGMPKAMEKEDVSAYL
jgi:hypothetical protein